MSTARRPLSSRREPSERGERLQPRGDLAQIDLRLQEGDLGVDRRLADVDVPRPRSSVAAVAPSVAATLQDILQLERRLLGPHPHRFLSRLLQQNRKRRRARGWQFDGKDLDEGVTVVDGPVRVVKEAGTVQKVAKYSSTASIGRRSGRNTSKDTSPSSRRCAP
jgi:hypothetical protein